jgi:hypothetical protein
VSRPGVDGAQGIGKTDWERPRAPSRCGGWELSADGAIHHGARDRAHSSAGETHADILRNGLAVPDRSAFKSANASTVTMPPARV